MKGILCLLVILANLSERYVIAEHEEDASTDLFVIEGKVFPWDNAASTGWQLMTHVMANGGEHYGFLRYVLASAIQYTDLDEFTCADASCD